MQLTKFTDYSLRVLMYFAAQPEKTASVAELAQCFAVSQNHLVKVVHQLVRAGYLHSLRGRSGGVQLACNPEEIALGDLIREFEQNTALVECFSTGSNSCPIAGVCGLQVILSESLEAFFSALNGYTLADAVAKPKRMLKALGAA